MKRLRGRTALQLGLSAGLIACSVLVASPAWAMEIFAETPNDGTLTLDVEPSDSIENVKQKLQDKTGVVPSDQCLLFNQVFLVDGQTLDFYGISRGERLDLVELPVTATWTITPDEPYLGGTVSNAIISHPGVTNAEVVTGSLPKGVTLNENTGQVGGTFAQPGAFDLKIAVDTPCGRADLRWSGVVTGTLADTGRSNSNVFGALGFGALALATGIVLARVRRRRGRAN